MNITVDRALVQPRIFEGGLSNVQGAKRLPADDINAHYHVNIPTKQSRTKKILLARNKIAKLGTPAGPVKTPPGQGIFEDRYDHGDLLHILISTIRSPGRSRPYTTLATLYKFLPFGAHWLGFRAESCGVHWSV